MGCGTNCLKITMNVFNALWMLGCVVVIGEAIYLMKYLPLSTVIVMIVCGGLGLATSILGCVGICKENPRFTAVYAGCIAVLLVLNIYMTFSGANPESFRQLGRHLIDDFWARESLEPGFMATIEKQYSCCGKTGPSDYRLLERGIPSSCYLDSRTNGLLFKNGCQEALESHFINNYRRRQSYGWIGIGFTILFLAGAIFLARRFKNQKQRSDF